MILRCLQCELFDCNVSSIISDGIDEPSTSLQEGANIEVLLCPLCYQLNDL